MAGMVKRWFQYVPMKAAFGKAFTGATTTMKRTETCKIGLGALKGEDREL